MGDPECPLHSGRAIWGSGVPCLCNVPHTIIEGSPMPAPGREGGTGAVLLDGISEGLEEEGGQMTRAIAAAAIAFGVIVLAYAISAPAQTAPACQRTPLPVVVNLDDIRHANLINHEREAIQNGQPRTLTLERDHAAHRRVEDLRGIPTKPGFDRDEYPPAFSEEAGVHSDERPRDDVAYVPSSENRSGGAVMGAALKPYCDGTRFIIEAGRP